MTCHAKGWWWLRLKEAIEHEALYIFEINHVNFSPFARFRAFSGLWKYAGILGCLKTNLQRVTYEILAIFFTSPFKARSRVATALAKRNETKLRQKSEPLGTFFFFTCFSLEVVIPPPSEWKKCVDFLIHWKWCFLSRLYLLQWIISFQQLLIEYRVRSKSWGQMTKLVLSHDGNKEQHVYERNWLQDLIFKE